MKVVINKQHILLSEQLKVLLGLQEKIEFLYVPENGWNRKEMIEIMKGMEEETIIFVSPIPFMLSQLSHSAGMNTCADLCAKEYPFAQRGLYKPSLVTSFCNDKRVTRELPNGKVISVISETGWYLS